MPGQNSKIDCRPVATAEDIDKRYRDGTIATAAGESERTGAGWILSKWL